MTLASRFMPFLMEWPKALVLPVSSEVLFTNEVPGGDFNDGTGLNLGTTMTVANPKNVSHIRFRATSTVSGTYIGGLYRLTSNTAGTLLGSETFGSMTGGDWNEVKLPVPVFVTSGFAYRPTVWTSAGRYTATSQFFASALVNGDLTGIQHNTNPVGIGQLNNGVFTVSGGLALPTSEFNRGCYFVDLRAWSNVGPFDDDFNAAEISPRWEHYNHTTGVTWTTDSGSAEIFTGAGNSTLDLWTGVDAAPSLMQRVSDFSQITVKLSALPSATYSSSSIRVDDGTGSNVIRAGAFYDGNPTAFAAKIDSGTASTQVDVDLGAISAPYWIRLTKSGTTYAFYTSPDGTNWTQRGSSFTWSGTVVRAGVAAITSGVASYTAAFDSFQIV